ncbi:hypothetical protein ACIPEQ_05845 [Curtobacterium sp. NPDC087080]|uniref:hypothetical protein n=1 Tax=unclassified Curtobacterium TaxID=257496 RepID=UPI000F87E790|nr:hypothetical protein [Curtobacterium sp. HSID17257]RUQ09660.1 hypothetical protein D8M35_01715 [Curtobacterium sp. HSID17257]
MGDRFAEVDVTEDDPISARVLLSIVVLPLEPRVVERVRERLARRNRWRVLVSNLVEVSEQFPPQCRKPLPGVGGHERPDQLISVAGSDNGLPL